MQNSHPHSRWRLGMLLAQLWISPIGSAVAAMNENVLTAEEQGAGWQLLFDGESLDQWRTYRQPAANPQWQAVNGELTLTAPGGGDLITKATWGNFELHLDWRISQGGNSGIFILADESGDYIFLKAPEIQLLDDLRHPDNKPASHRSGSLYDLVAAPPESQLPAESWNQVVIRHENGHLEVWQNDVPTVDIQIGGERWQTLVAASKFSGWAGFGTLTSGHIGLQDHGNVVAFRNLKILPLAEAP